ncbi:MAG: SMC-Scp complex subunit ScpB [Candidatus Aenigmatarchaeota archaeon]
MHDDKARLALMEAMLFTTHEPLSLHDIAKALKIRDEKVEELVVMLREKYINPEHGISLSEAGGFRLVVKHQFIEKVSHLTPHADMSRGVLRVLSIVAFHEPIAQCEIVKIIGNRTYEYVKELNEKVLIKSEKKGRTRMLSTTPHFEEYFGISKEEFKKQAGEAKLLESKKKKVYPEPEKKDDNKKQENESDNENK